MFDWLISGKKHFYLNEDRISAENLPKLMTSVLHTNSKQFIDEIIFFIPESLLLKSTKDPRPLFMISLYFEAACLLYALETVYSCPQSVVLSILESCSKELKKIAYPDGRYWSNEDIDFFKRKALDYRNMIAIDVANYDYRVWGSMKHAENVVDDVMGKYDVSLTPEFLLERFKLVTSLSVNHKSVGESLVESGVSYK